MLEYIITSKVTRKLLTQFLTHSGERFYTRQLERILKEPVSAVRRELKKLESAGLLAVTNEGRERYYVINRNNPIFPDLKNIVFKTQLSGDYLGSFLKKSCGIRLAFVYGSMAQGKEHGGSDIDIMVVGNIKPEVLHKQIRQMEELLHRQAQYTLLSSEEFAKRSDTYLKRVIKDKKIFLIGDNSELKAIREGT